VELTSFVLRADLAAEAWIVAHRVPMLDGVMWTLSAIGRGGAVFLASGLALLAARKIDRRDLLRLAAAILLATATADYIVKPAVDRRRPFDRQATLRVIGGRPHDASFPSGHAANGFAGALVLSRVVPAFGTWWALAVAVAFSRVYLGVHYPTDVLAGAIIGLIWGAVVGRLHTPARSC
jgi:undecaprenyl-diphosphatase